MPFLYRLTSNIFNTFSYWLDNVLRARKTFTWILFSKFCLLRYFALINIIMVKSICPIWNPKSLSQSSTPTIRPRLYFQKITNFQIMLYFLHLISLCHYGISKKKQNDLYVRLLSIVQLFHFSLNYVTYKLNVVNILTNYFCTIVKQ